MCFCSAEVKARVSCPASPAQEVSEHFSSPSRATAAKSRAKVHRAIPSQRRKIRFSPSAAQAWSLKGVRAARERSQILFWAFFYLLKEELLVTAGVLAKGIRIMI